MNRVSFQYPRNMSFTFVEACSDHSDRTPVCSVSKSGWSCFSFENVSHLSETASEFPAHSEFDTPQFCEFESPSAALFTDEPTELFDVSSSEVSSSEVSSSAVESSEIGSSEQSSELSYHPLEMTRCTRLVILRFNSQVVMLQKT